jgi:hypothetical protein
MTRKERSGGIGMAGSRTKPPREREKPRKPYPGKGLQGLSVSSISSGIFLLVAACFSLGWAGRRTGRSGADSAERQRRSRPIPVFVGIGPLRVKMLLRAW